MTALQIPKSHASVGMSNLVASNKQFRSLVLNRKLPEVGWSDVQIQQLLYSLSILDTNSPDPVVVYSADESDDDDDNVGSVSDGGGGGPSRWCGVGEREGRIYSQLVSSRHFGMGHGIGRSGDVTEPQPKAVGSTLLAKLTQLLVLDLARTECGLNAQTTAAHGIVLPMCTGMSISLVLSSMRNRYRSGGNGAQDERQEGVDDTNNEQQHTTKKKTFKTVVLWSRIDQKSCYKAIEAAGLEVIVVPTLLTGDEVSTDLVELERLLTQQYTPSEVLAVVTTTSCFAPRVPDNVDEVAKICKKHDVCHLVNHAYGLQCRRTNKLLNRACVVGRVDAVVCSTDKNFLVPVGGAIVLSPSAQVVQGVSKTYAGRASSSPIVDLFVTLLSMGASGYRNLFRQREALVPQFKRRLEAVAAKYGERLLQCPSNTISFGITLDSLVVDDDKDDDDKASKNKLVSEFGSMLFRRCVSGTRVVPRDETKRLGSHEFRGFGGSTDRYPHSYMTAACAIGLAKGEMNEFFIRLDKTFSQYRKLQAKRQKKAAKERTHG